MLSQKLKKKIIDEMDLIHGCFLTVEAAPASMFEDDDSSMSALTFFDEQEMPVGLFRVEIDQVDSGAMRISLQTPFVYKVNFDYRLSKNIMELKDWVNTKILKNEEMVISVKDNHIELKMLINSEDFYLPEIMEKMYPAYAAAYVRFLKIILGAGLTEADYCSPDDFLSEYEYI